MASVHDVAAYILDKSGPMSHMKLQKLVYYCQAWSLVWDEEPLFPERIEAWVSGPVVPSLFAELRKLFRVVRPWQNARKGLQPDQRGRREITCAALAEYYGSL